MPRMGKPFYKVRLPFTTNYTCTVLKVTTWTYCDIYRHTSIGRITQSYNRMACKLLQQETIISDFIYIISICLKHKPRYLVQRIPLIKYNSTIFNRAFCHPHQIANTSAAISILHACGPPVDCVYGWLTFNNSDCERKCQLHIKHCQLY